MRNFRIFILFLFMQVLLHFIAGIFSTIEQDELFCFLDQCVYKRTSPVLASFYKYSWFVYFILFLFITSFSRIYALISSSVLGVSAILLFSSFTGYQIDLFIIFAASGLLSVLFKQTLSGKRTKEGFPLWLVLSYCMIVILFPISWGMRSIIQPNTTIPESWELTMILMSILSIVALFGLLAAIFAKPNKEKKGPEPIRPTNKKQKRDSPVIEAVVSLFYFGSLFIGTHHIRDANPLSIFYPLLLFWLVIYPILKNKKNQLLKSIVFTVYVISFLFSFDGLIYNVVEILISSEDFMVILSDYIVIMIYLSMYPLFKTLPEYYLMSKSKNKTFGQVFKEGFVNELLILLFILMKMNASYYQF